MRRMPGPKWLGIGAQRSGTDWISRLICQHPKVDFGTNDVKEQQIIHRIVDSRATEEEYLALFPDDGIYRGDWSPRYMPLMTVPAMAKRLISDETPLFVLLRDPVERLGSAMRYSKKRKRLKSDYNEPALSRAHQFGQYAGALEGWKSYFPKERFVILTYEEAREDVQAACEVFWRALGVDSHKLKDPYGRVKPATEGEIKWELPEGTREALIAHYLPQVTWLRDHWSVDVSRWRSFQGLV